MGKKLFSMFLLALLVLPYLPYFPTTNANGGDYVLLIIAPDEFLDELQRLKDWKDATGRPTLMVGLGAIYSSFGGGDEAEDIKLAIADYKEDYPTIDYVMLVGDVDTMPVRYFYVNETNATHLKWLKYYITDHYYADLYNGDGSFNDWDADENGLYAQTPLISDAYENHDDLNFHFDVAVGRVPASTAGEVENYIDKVMQYEGTYSRDQAWFKKVLLLTGEGDDRYEPDTDIDQNDDIAARLGPGYTQIKLYDETGYTTPTPALINYYINEGVGFVNIVCHANRELWGGVYDVTADMTTLDNVETLPIIWSFGCSSASFGPLPPQEDYVDTSGTDQTAGYPLPKLLPYTEPERPDVLQSGYDLDSMPEYWLVRESDSGAIAFIGSTAEAVLGPGYALNDDFFDAFSEGNWTIGDVWMDMGEKYLADHNVESGDRTEWENCRRWLFMNLFGDPSLMIGGLPNTPPVADAGPDQTVEQTSPTGASVVLDGTGSYDADSDTLTYTWTWDSETATGSSPTVSLPPGMTTVTLEVSDGIASDTDTVTITVQDTTPPYVDPGPDQSEEQETHAGTEVTLYGTVTDAADPAPEIEWTEGLTVLGTAATLTHTFNLGTHTVTLTAMDASGNSASATVTVVIYDTTPPEVDAGPDQTLEQTSHDGAEVTLTGSATDNCDPDLAYAWYEGGEQIGDTATLTLTLPYGTHTLTLEATDESCNTGSDEVVVEIVDTTPPEITASSTPAILWSPNHKYVNIVVTVAVTDICDPAPTFALVSATSNEPDDAIGSGDGNTINDIVIIDSTHLKLRAERAGGGTGRIYAMTYLATDHAGNTAMATTEVFVPLDWY